MKGFIEVTNTENMRVLISVATISSIKTVEIGDTVQILTNTKSNNVIRTYTPYDDIKSLIEKALI